MFIWKTVIHTAVFWISSLLIQLLHLHCWLLTSFCLLYRQPGGKLFEIDRSNYFFCSGKTTLTRHLILGIVWKTILSTSRQTYFYCKWLTQGQKGGWQAKMVFFSFLSQVSQIHLAILCFQTFNLALRKYKHPFQSLAYFHIIFYTSLYILLFPPLMQRFENALYIMLYLEIDWLVDVVLSHLMFLSIFSWPQLSPRPSATSSISAADLEIYLWVWCTILYLRPNKQHVLSLWFLPPFPDLIPEAHITWRGIWLPQSCRRDQMIEFSKCRWSNSREANCDQ